MATLQEECPEVGVLYKFHDSGTLPESEVQANICLKTQDQYVLDNRVLYHIYFPGNRNKAEHMVKQVVVPKANRQTLLASYHNDRLGGGHQGLDCTYSHLLMKYYWPGMYTQLARYISTCEVCQRVKHTRSHPPPLTPMPVAGIFRRWHMDFLSLKPTPDGYKYVLLFVDSTSKWCEAFPTKNQEAETVANLLYENIITRFGAPDELLSDLGRQFTSKLMRALCKLCDIKHTFTSPYHPQTNAACERLNSFISQSIRAYNTADQNRWPLLIPSIMMAYRCTPATRSTELSPFETLFGESMHTPVDVELMPRKTLQPRLQQYLQDRIYNVKLFRQITAENIKRHQAEYKEDHDKHKHIAEPHLEEGQLVLMSDEAVPVGHAPKLHPPFKGPFTIVTCGPHYTYLLEDINGKRLTHAINGRRLKPFHMREQGRPTPQAQPPSVQHSQQHCEEPLEDIRHLLDETLTTPDTNIQAQRHRRGGEQRASQQPPTVTPRDDASEAQDKAVIRPDMVEEIIKITRTNTKGVKHYRVKLKGTNQRLWVYRESVPSDMLHRYHMKQTMSGRVRKRNRQRYLEPVDE